MKRKTICTVGHSTRAFEEFLELLREKEIELLADIRTVPKSERNPQYHEDNLPVHLKESGIEYIRIEQLGGFRRAMPGSVNKAWRNSSFRGYADYMQTPQFAKGLSTLIALADTYRVAVVCAEMVPWRCHRFLLSDALLVAGANVEHIISAGNVQPHMFCKFAHVENKSKIVYGAAC